MDPWTFISGWQGRVYRHIPADSSFGPLDGRFATRVADNRWNVAGEPTLYFGSGFGVLVAEFGRHFRELRIAGAGERTRARRLYAIDIGLDRVFDLRQPAAAMTFGLFNAPACFLDRSIAQNTASFLRNALGVQAAFVPSMALLDDPTRWNLVIFEDQLDGSIASVVTNMSEAGMFRFESRSDLPT